MTTSEQTTEIAPALSRAQGALKPAVKDADNPAFRSKYADLASVWDACREALSTNGLAALQDVHVDDSGVQVTTRLMHASGQWVEFGPLTVPLTKKDAHGVGSGISYARRYGLSAALGIVAGDDDGNAAVGKDADRATVKPDAATRKARVMPKAAEAEGAVYIVKVIPKSKGNTEWAEVIFSTGESIITHARGCITLAMELAQENSPVLVTKRMNAKGNPEIEELARWTLDGPVRVELPLKASDIPF